MEYEHFKTRPGMKSRTYTGRPKQTRLSLKLIPLQINLYIRCDVAESFTLSFLH